MARGSCHHSRKTHREKRGTGSLSGTPCFSTGRPHLGDILEALSKQLSPGGPAERSPRLGPGCCREHTITCCLQQNALVVPPQVPGDAAPPSSHRLTPKKDDEEGRQLTLYDHICKASFLKGSRVTFHCGESNTYVSLELLCSVF